MSPLGCGEIKRDCLRKGGGGGGGSGRRFRAYETQNLGGLEVPHCGNIALI